MANHVPTVVVKDFLGRATVATTEIYYINTKPAMRAAVKARKFGSNQTNRTPRRGETDGQKDSKPEM